MGNKKAGGGVKDRAPLYVHVRSPEFRNQSEMTPALEQCLLCLTFYPESFKMHPLAAKCISGERRNRGTRGEG